MRWFWSGLSVRGDYVEEDVRREYADVSPWIPTDLRKDFLKKSCTLTEFMHRMLWHLGVREECFTYWYLGDPGRPDEGHRRSLDIAIGMGFKIMMDSGAHTLQEMASRKHQMPTKEAITDYCKQYAEFCHNLGDKLEVCVTADYVREPKACWFTHGLLESYGMHPLPVFHGLYDIEWLYRYVDKGYDWVGLGFELTQRNKRPISEKIIRLLTQRYGKIPKIHGFAISPVSAAAIIPWYSADSTTWRKVAAIGAVLHNHEGKLRNLGVTDRRSAWARDAQLWCQFSPEKQASFRAEVEAEGWTMESLRFPSTLGFFSRAMWNTFQLVRWDKENLAAKIEEAGCQTVGLW